MRTTIWEVQYLSPPEVIRHCKKCAAKTAHISSGLFRINAQQKALDIWLVYRCERCKNTWNATIFSRVHPKVVPAALLEKFTANDPSLGWKYAMDSALIKKNGGEMQPPDFVVLGPPVDLCENMRIDIHSRYPSEMKISQVLRNKLGLSSKAFGVLAKSGALSLQDGRDIQKSKLQTTQTVLYHQDR